MAVQSGLSSFKRANIIYPIIQFGRFGFCFYRDLFFVLNDKIV